MDAALLKKLLVRPGNRVLVLNAPEGYLDRLTPLPDGASFVAQDDAANQLADVVQLFVHNKADVDALASQAMTAVKPGGVLWLTYPKRSKTVQTDINRDTGWDALKRAGWLGVTQIAVDETWSALRFRPASEIKTLTRKFS